ERDAAASPGQLSAGGARARAHLAERAPRRRARQLQEALQEGLMVGGRHIDAPIALGDLVPDVDEIGMLAGVGSGHDRRSIPLDMMRFDRLTTKSQEALAAAQE